MGYGSKYRELRKRRRAVAAGLATYNVMTSWPHHQGPLVYGWFMMVKRDSSAVFGTTNY